MTAHTVSYVEGDSIILIVYHGAVTLDDVKTVRAKAIELTKQHACTKMLTDFRDASFELSTLDIFELPKTTSDAYSEKDISVYEVKRAIVMNDDTELLSFLETVSVTRGQSMKLFTEIDKARDWLLDDSG